MLAVKISGRPQIWLSVTHLLIVIDSKYYLKISVLGLRNLHESVQVACLSITVPKYKITLNHAQYIWSQNCLYYIINYFGATSIAVNMTKQTVSNSHAVFSWQKIMLTVQTWGYMVSPVSFYNASNGNWWKVKIRMSTSGIPLLIHSW